MDSTIKINKFITIISLLTLVGCAKPMVAPNRNNIFTVTATAPEKAAAYNAAANKAVGICKQEESITVIDREIINQDKDFDQIELIRMAKNILPASKTKAADKPLGNTYKAKLTFSCAN